MNWKAMLFQHQGQKPNAPHSEPNLLLLFSLGMSHGCSGRGDKCRENPSNSVQASWIQILSIFPCHDSARIQLTAFPGSSIGALMAICLRYKVCCAPSLSWLPGITRGLEASPHPAALESTFNTPGLCAEDMLVNKMGITSALLSLLGRETKKWNNNIYHLLSTYSFLGPTPHTQYVFSNLVFTTVLWGVILQMKE